MTNRVFITGDKHGDFGGLETFCYKNKTTKDDVMIILGDSGINYFLGSQADGYKRRAQKLPIKLFCIHGNHEERATNIKTYNEKVFWEGKVSVEDKYPDLIFAIDGEVYNIPTLSGTKEAIAIGGAYSVDKEYRLSHGANWYSSEQPSDKIKSKVEQVLEKRNGDIDIILSHTCPYRYIPREWFITSINQDTVDNSTELWLDKICSRLNRYDKWYCGHYHGDKSIDKMVFMFRDIIEI